MHLHIWINIGNDSGTFAQCLKLGIAFWTLDSRLHKFMGYWWESSQTFPGCEPREIDSRGQSDKSNAISMAQLSIAWCATIVRRGAQPLPEALEGVAAAAKGLENSVWQRTFAWRRSLWDSLSAIMLKQDSMRLKRCIMWWKAHKLLIVATHIHGFSREATHQISDCRLFVTFNLNTFASQLC